MMEKHWNIRLCGEAPVIRFAAEEFRRLLGRMDPNATFGTGGAPLVIGLDSSLPQPPQVEDPVIDDAILIDVKGGAGMITGSNGRSVLIAVYRFFREAGCVFLRPGKGGEWIPQRDSFSLNIHVCEAAAYRHRGICLEGSNSYENAADMIDFAPKLGFNAFFTQLLRPSWTFRRWYEHTNNDCLAGAPLDHETVDAFVERYSGEIALRGLHHHRVGHGWATHVLGITSTAATSDAMNHTWNMVYLDGAWYHIDVTWNDPTGPDMPYRARHFYFLVSDSAMTASRGHYDWEASATAGSTKYDDYFWVNNNNPIPVIGNTMYYVSGEDACTVYGWTASAGSTAIHTFEARGSNGWLSPGNHPLGANQTRLYYATGDAVYSIPVEGGMPVQEYWIDDENALILYGYLNGSSMGLCVQDAETNAVTTHSFTIGQAAAVSLDQMLIELTEGESVQLTAEVYPEDAEITWAAEGAAGVDETGLVTGLEAGAARVTATVGESVAECIVIVRSDEQIIVPDTVVEIKEGAFANSGAVDVVLPEGIEVIGDNAFKGCADLKIVAMPANFAENASVSETAFADCSGVTLLVKEGSFAHEYAVAAELDYILVP